MEIRMQDTGNVVTEQEFRAMFPNTGFPVQLTADIISEFGGDVVLEGPQATCDRYQFSMLQGVEQIDGKWYTKYVAGPIFVDGETTAAEQEAAYKAQKDAEQAASQRQQRNQKLSETDWRFCSDLTPSQEWKDYRQALRDVPSQPGFPWDIQWPTQPE